MFLFKFHKPSSRDAYAKASAAACRLLLSVPALQTGSPLRSDLIQKVSKEIKAVSKIELSNNLIQTFNNYILCEI